MKPSRRSRIASNGSSKRPKPTPVSPPKPPPQSESSPTHIPVSESPAQSSTALTAAARYQRNLKSLRRIDPTIVSIIDQFSHICLYRLQEGKWQKDGFEGASFLFERAAYPPYGLFILNRAGMHDYIHPIHPEDEIQPEGEYLMYRSYPEFTGKRLAMAKSAPATLTESWTDTYCREPSASDPLTNWRYLLNQKPDKGPHETVMFWFLGSESEQHEPLADTMERLMACIRKGEPYPYNLDRPPPLAQHPALTDMKSQDASATSPVDVSSEILPDQNQSNGAQSLMSAINGTGSEIDKLFSKLITAASPAPTPLNSFTSPCTSASSTAASNLVRPSSTCTNKGPALLDTIFASATPPLYSIPAPTPPPLPHHVSSEPFPPPPSAPPSTRLAFATAHLRTEISSSEPESSEPTSPTYAAAQLIHSPQPTTSQLPQILTQDVISALLGMPPSRTSSVASSHRRYEGDIESSDDLHEAESPVDERPQTHANRTRKHELGDVTPRPPLRGFASSEKVLPSPAPPLPSYHSAPSALPSAASSAPSVPAPPEPIPIPIPAPTVVVDEPTPVVPAPRIGSSPAPRALVPFHEESSLWPYPRAPLDDRDDIVELDFADTSALSDVDAFERRRQSSKKAKLSRKDRRDEIERSWDAPGYAAPSVVAAGSTGPHPILGRPSSSQAPVHNTVVSSLANGSAATWPSSQSGAVKTNQTNTAPTLVKTPEPTSTRGPVTAPTPPSSNNKSKAKSKHVVNGSNAKVSVPDMTQTQVQCQTQANGTTALAKPAVSTAIVEAVQVHSRAHSNVNGNASSMTTDRTEFVREVLTLIHTDASFVDRLWTEYRARA